MKWIFENQNEIELQLPPESAFLGASVFTTFRTKNRQPIWYEDHTARLLNHAKALGFFIPKRSAFDQAVEHLTLFGKDLRVRFMLTESRFFYSAEPFVAPNQKVYDGVSVHISKQQIHPSLGKYKTGNYLPYLLAKKEARDQGAFEGLLLNKDGHLVDGSRTSLLLFQGDKLISLLGGLDSICRRQVLQKARELSIETTVRYIKPSELHGTLLLASSTMGLIPVGRPHKTIQSLIDWFRIY